MVTKISLNAFSSFEAVNYYIVINHTQKNASTLYTVCWKCCLKTAEDGN